MSTRKLPPELAYMEDRFERAARFYPDWTISAATAYFANPDAPKRLSDFSDAVQGLTMSLNPIAKALHDKPWAMEAVWPNADKAIKEMKHLAIKADEVLVDTLKLSDFPGTFEKQKGRLLNRLKGIVASYLNEIAPLTEVGVPLGRVASLRSATLQLAAAQPVGSPLRRGLLATLQQKVADANTPPSITSLMADLSRVPGVKSVYITDTWKDGYFHLRAVLEAKGTVDGGRQLGATFDIQTRATGGYVKVFNLPNYPKTVMGIKAAVKRSGLTVEGFAGPTKLYEYQDAWAKAQREFRLSGYEGNEVSIEVYV